MDFKQLNEELEKLLEVDINKLKKGLDDKQAKIDRIKSKIAARERQAVLKKYDFILTTSDKDFDVIDALNTHGWIVDELNAGETEAYLIAERSKNISLSSLKRGYNYYGINISDKGECYLGFGSDKENRNLFYGIQEWSNFYEDYPSFNVQADEWFVELKKTNKYKQMKDGEKKLAEDLSKMTVEERYQFFVNEVISNVDYFDVYQVTYPELIRIKGDLINITWDDCFIGAVFELENGDLLEVTDMGEDPVDDHEESYIHFDINGKSKGEFSEGRFNREGFRGCLIEV
jgi:hypothetical protein